jgi:hypothetical protein
MYIGHAGTTNTFSIGNDASFNTSVGAAALDSNTRGNLNTAVGYAAGTIINTGIQNTAIGALSLNSIAGASDNTAVGYNALYGADGNRNVAIGSNAAGTMAGYVTSSIYIGYNTVGANPAFLSQTNNEIVIGDSAVGNGDNSVTLGNTNITKTILRANVGIGNTAPTHSLTVQGFVTASAFTGSFRGDGSGLTGVVASATPGGVNTTVQFNDAGATSGSTSFTFTKATNTVKIQGSGSTLLHISGSAGNLLSVVDSGSNFPVIATFSSGSRDVLTITTSSINVIGSVSASSYLGSGASLTGIVTQIVAGTNVTISPVGGTGAVTINSSGGGGGGSTTGSILLTAAGGWPSLTNGCQPPQSAQTTTNQVNFYYLGFPDGATTTFANWAIPMPGDYNGGTITAVFYWVAGNASTNSVVWGLAARAYADSDVLDQAFGTQQQVTDANQANDDVNISAATPAITIGGTPAAGNFVQFRANRDPANASDTLAATAELLAIRITYTRV